MKFRQTQFQAKKFIQDIWVQVFPPRAADMRDDLPVIPMPSRGPAQTKADIDAYLQVLFNEIATYAPAQVPSLIVTGAMRCGKTLLTRRLARRNGLYHIPSDRLRHATYIASDEATKQRVVKYIYKRLLLAYPTGLALDGTLFLDNGVTVPHWAAQRGIRCVAIGYALDDAARKAQSMIDFRKSNNCWTSHNKSEADVLYMAHQIVSRSKEIKGICDTQGWDYFDLDSGAFSREKRRIIYAVEKLLHQRQTAPRMRGAVRDRSNL
ncbi:MAG: hypothetical protein JJU08_16095 [Rhodobacteraceae bacterium]|nr:hypothetical protein [Paracoccaceae bacterium]